MSYPKKFSKSLMKKKNVPLMEEGGEVEDDTNTGADLAGPPSRPDFGDDILRPSRPDFGDDTPLPSQADFGDDISKPKPSTDYGDDVTPKRKRVPDYGRE